MFLHLVLHTTVWGPRGTHLGPLFHPFLTLFLRGPKRTISLFDLHSPSNIRYLIFLVIPCPFLSLWKLPICDDKKWPFLWSKREIVTLCFHLLCQSFKKRLLQTHENPCCAPCLFWWPKNDHFCDSTVGPCTTFWTSSMAWVDGYHLPIIDGGRMRPLYNPEGNTRAFHDGTHHVLCYLSSCSLVVAPLKNMTFRVFTEFPFFAFFGK